MSLRHLPSRRPGGFTLIELMVTVAVIGLMLGLAAPSIGMALLASRERSVVQRFTQDYEWLRSQAGAAGVTATTLTLNGNCTWAASVSRNGVASPDAEHSMSATSLAQMSPSSTFTCASPEGSLPLPVTFNFTSQGFVSPNGKLKLSGSSGTEWQLQVLYSGSIVRAAS